MRTWGWAIVIGLSVAVAGGGWYVRPILHARLVGVDWRAAVRASHCITMRRELWCTTNWPLQMNVTTYTTLQLKRVTRGVIRISRNWTLADSTSWGTLVDSTRRAMAARHGEQLPCDTAETGFEFAEAWAFGAQETRLYAAPIRATTTRGASWYLSVQLVPRGAAGCGRAFRYTFPRPEQFAQSVRDWIASQLGF